MRLNAIWLALFAAAVIAGVTCLSIVYASPFARTWDEVDFTLALHRYDLLAMQPHFPGYPYFILGGWFINQWMNNPVKALSVFNTLAALSSALPMFLLANRLTGSGMKSLLLPALVLSSPYIWLMSSRPMSECAGMALLWWFLWSIRFAMDRPGSLLRHGLVLLMFGFLMGTRLSFFPYGLALVPLWHGIWQYGARGWRRWLRLGCSALTALWFQLLWIAGLVLSEGTLAGFWKLSVAFVEGHFSEWGGGVISTPIPLGERIYQLIGHNLLGSALLGGSVFIGLWLVIIVVAAFIGRRFVSVSVQGNENRRYIFWLVGCAVLYTLWALFGQNIEKPRHIAPVVAPILLLMFAFIIRTAEGLRTSTHRTRLLRIAPTSLYALLISLITIQVVYGAQLQKRQAVEEPAVYQLHDYVSSLQGPLLLFTWEETRVLQYLQADYDHQRIYTYEYFQAVAGANSERRVLLTDHVVQGFAQQGKSVKEHVKQLAEFKSDALFDPAYAHVILYEWVR
ncbi:hypothetical protein QFZ77_001061 [Paenibacillus sp. V4I3]|uniref:nucleoporin-interacting protein n=1 Tax=unclassified Paenibacillus TaxID=185978 RepID=UPI0027834DA8|nr:MULTISPECIES: nucleoporin-interacting protein [unclassified Paenibacillus]MDQ0872402.1 hypothetical protein [Paenibacillus sp. V4I3]MDQ0891711.1 hypothetical protein [Paenibacillus sp. V4I9]